MKFGNKVIVKSEQKNGFYKGATGVIFDFDGGGTYKVELIFTAKVSQMNANIVLDLQNNEMELIEE